MDAVLVAGGFDGATLASAEVMDIDNPAWSAGPNLGQNRAEPSLTLLRSGKVLAVGGVGLNTAEI